jgi:hypothetical protein
VKCPVSRTKSYKDAATWLEKTHPADPNRREAHGNIADAWMKLARNADAKKHFELYLELYPNSPKGPKSKRCCRACDHTSSPAARIRSSALLRVTTPPRIL